MTAEMKELLERQLAALEAYDAVVLQHINSHAEVCMRVSSMEAGTLQTLLGALGCVHGTLSVVRGLIAALPKDIQVYEQASSKEDIEA